MCLVQLSRRRSKKRNKSRKVWPRKEGAILKQLSCPKSPSHNHWETLRIRRLLCWIRIKYSSKVKNMLGLQPTKPTTWTTSTILTAIPASGHGISTTETVLIRPRRWRCMIRWAICRIWQPIASSWQRQQGTFRGPRAIKQPCPRSTPKKQLETPNWILSSRKWSLRERNKKRPQLEGMGSGKGWVSASHWSWSKGTGHSRCCLRPKKLRSRWPRKVMGRNKLRKWHRSRWEEDRIKTITSCQGRRVRTILW